MQILADLMSDESGGEYVYEVCKDGKPVNEEESDKNESGICTEEVRAEKESEESELHEETLSRS